MAITLTSVDVDDDTFSASRYVGTIFPLATRSPLRPPMSVFFPVEITSE